MSALCLSVQDAPLSEQLLALWPEQHLSQTLPWSEALQRLQDPQATPIAVWVLSVDAAHGPDRRELQQAWAGGLPQSRVLVLLPQALHSEASAWLDMGVDRCLRAPCDPREVAAMVRALARHSWAPVCEVSEWAGLSFDHRAMTLSQGDQRIALTQREAELMALLMRRIGKIVTSQDLLLQLGRGASQPFRPAMVQLYVHRVNRKIAPHGLHIDCVKRVGYVLRASAEPPAQPLWTAWPAPLPAAPALRPQTRLS